MRRVDLSRRITELEAAITPASSRSARVKQLCAADRAEFEAWLHAQKEWHKQFSAPAAAYEAFLCGENDPPELSERIVYQLYDVSLKIPINSKLIDAAEMYRRMREIK